MIECENCGEMFAASGTFVPLVCQPCYAAALTDDGMDDHFCTPNAIECPICHGDGRGE
jgi:hypothetical protein